MQDPLIILSPPRSFTSVVCAMLGQHPQMYGLPEVNLFVAETMIEREGIIAQPRWSGHGLLRAVAQLFSGKQSVATISLAQHWLDIRAHTSCVSVFRELAHTVSPRLLVDKSPRTVMQVEYLYRARRAFPNARFLHLTRHPRKQCESMMKFGGGVAGIFMESYDYSTDPPTLDVQKAWYRTNANIVTFLTGVPTERWKRIRGEDLLADPDFHLKEIATWLGLRADNEAIDMMKHPERSPFAGFGPLNAVFGNDPGFLRNPVLRQTKNGSRNPSLEGPLDWREDAGSFSPEVRDLANEFGYR